MYYLMVCVCECGCRLLGVYAVQLRKLVGNFVSNWTSLPNVDHVIKLKFDSPCRSYISFNYWAKYYFPFLKDYSFFLIFACPHMSEIWFWTCSKNVTDGSVSKFFSILHFHFKKTTPYWSFYHPIKFEFQSMPCRVRSFCSFIITVSS